MSNAISQSTNKLSTSTVQESDFPFQSVLDLIAQRKVGNDRTLGNKGLKRGSLLSALCNQYRAHYTQLYPSKDDKGQTLPLPSAVYDKLCAEVDIYLDSILKSVHSGNVISHRRAFYWHRK